MGPVDDAVTSTESAVFCRIPDGTLETSHCGVYLREWLADDADSVWG